MKYFYKGDLNEDYFHIKELFPHRIQIDPTIWKLDVADVNQSSSVTWIKLNDEFINWLNLNLDKSSWKWWIEDEFYFIAFKDKDVATMFKLSFLNEKEEN